MPGRMTEGGVAMDSEFAAWVGRQQGAIDTLDPLRSNALLRALGMPGAGQAGGELPQLHHWLHFWDVREPQELGEDGHPAKGGFLPPIPLPRRMWAGGRLEFRQPLHFGERVEKITEIKSIAAKSGRSGPLVFVTLEHRISGESGLAVIEEQDLVYREAASAAMPMPAGADTAPAAGDPQTVMPDPVMLFRYSALTMNGHRIHYDRPYATGEEAYPALVVHGPLQATILAARARQDLGRNLRSFAFRGQSPAFDSLPLHVCSERAGEALEVWTQQRGSRNMVATAS